MVGGDRGNAEVDWLPRDPHLDAPVLRQPLFRDAHRASHDFQPADDGRLQSLRRRLHFLEDPVDPETDAEFFIERLEMHVTRAQLVRFDEKHRNHADDRRVRFIRPADVAAFDHLEPEIDVVPDLFRQNIGRFISRAVIFDERLPDFIGAGADQLDLALQQEAEAVDRVDIERIAHRHDQSAFAEADRDNLETPRVHCLNLFDHFRRDDLRREIDPIHVRLGGEAAGNVGLGDCAFLDEQINGVAAAVEPRPGILNLGTRDESGVLEKF